MAKQVAIQDCLPGMYILGIIEQNGPVKIKKTGLITSVEMVQGLAEMGVVSVAIDPEKTVEIEVEDSHHVSQTQFVMKANQELPVQNADNHLSEQFNRSLFMPSLQQVPSAWQFYGVRAAVVALVMIVGFTSGWFASYLFSSKNNASESTIAQTQDKPKTEQKLPAADSTQQIPESNKAEQDDAKISQAITEPENIESTPATPVEEQQPAENLASGSQNLETEVDTLDNRTEFAEANDSPAPVVSPELMQRFEAAMADLERESSPTVADDGESLEYGNASNDYNRTQVQRVDQLPARVMTRLPSMSFSAHMYASNPRDRWVKLNGIEMGEGEWLDDKLFIERIEPQHVILVFEGHQFSMRALSEW